MNSTNTAPRYRPTIVLRLISQMLLVLVVLGLLWIASFFLPITFRGGLGLLVLALLAALYALEYYFNIVSEVVAVMLVRRLGNQVGESRWARILVK